jgi:AbrB family looped-hinge helix DNA binding protein
MRCRMAIATVSEKGWVVIPQEIRKRYGLKKGDKVHVIDSDGRIAIIPVARDPIAAGLGMFRGGPSMTKGLLEDRRRELEREERDLPLPRLEE